MQEEAHVSEVRIWRQDEQWAFLVCPHPSLDNDIEEELHKAWQAARIFSILVYPQCVVPANICTRGVQVVNGRRSCTAKRLVLIQVRMVQVTKRDLVTQEGSYPSVTYGRTSFNNTVGANKALPSSKFEVWITEGICRACAMFWRSILISPIGRLLNRVARSNLQPYYRHVRATCLSSTASSHPRSPGSTSCPSSETCMMTAAHHSGDE